MHLSPDNVVFWRRGPLGLNLTLVTTWALMAVLATTSWLVTRRLTTDVHPSRWQSVLEILVTGLEQQIAEVGLTAARRYLPFLGTLFVFVGFANLCIVFPGYEPPTGSLSTTAALALCVFIAVPGYGIAEQGLRGYLRSYLQPTVLMLPFNIVAELSRTLALAIRLFGNIMSGSLIVAILLTITPFLFPVAMNALGLLTGVVQAYIFGILATVYVTAATRGEGA